MARPKETWSIVIPALCESEHIAAAVETARRASPHPPCEVIVVDGGSADGTARAARRAGAKVLQARRGRGAQLNAGWRAARGDWVLFLHADTRLPPDYGRLIDGALRDAEAAAERRRRRPWWLGGGGGGGGDSCTSSSSGSCALDSSFSDSRCQHHQQQQQQQQQHRPNNWLRWIGLGRRRTNSHSTPSPPPPCAPPAWGCFASIDAGASLHPFHASLLRAGVALRTRALGLPYGDQGLFVRRACLQQLEGFREWPLLEDADMARRLRAAAGRPAIAPACLSTSGRRWQRFGFWRTFAVNQAVLCGWAAGVDVNVLADWYRQAAVRLAAEDDGSRAAAGRKA